LKSTQVGLFHSVRHHNEEEAEQECHAKADTSSKYNRLGVKVGNLDRQENHESEQVEPPKHEIEIVGNNFFPSY